MKRMLTMAALLAVALLGAGRAWANCYELGLRIQNDAGSYVATSVEIYRTECGGLVWSGASSATPQTDGTNLRLDLNNSCPGAVWLQPEVRYTVRFPNWSGKAFYFTGHLINGQPVDDTYTVRPGSLTWYSGAHVQSLNGYPTATWTPLCLTLVVDHTTVQGSKTNYFLKATASGGAPYTFSWGNATMTSGQGVNPSQAVRAVLVGQTVTVSCTVNGVVTRSLQLSGNPVTQTPVTPITWGLLKTQYR